MFQLYINQKVRKKYYLLAQSKGEAIFCNASKIFIPKISIRNISVFAVRARQSDLLLLFFLASNEIA